MLIVYCVIGFAIILLLVGNMIYDLRRPHRSANWQATIHGQTGKIVSHWPFDLWVTINIEGRTWLSAWRWNCTFNNRSA
jgi:hypothetical protein